jgi:hypothetical protein
MPKNSRSELQSFDLVFAHALFEHLAPRRRAGV